jgi:hypothetical protein
MRSPFRSDILIIDDFFGYIYVVTLDMALTMVLAGQYCGWIFNVVFGMEGYNQRYVEQMNS